MQFWHFKTSDEVIAVQWTPVFKEELASGQPYLTDVAKKPLSGKIQTFLPSDEFLFLVRLGVNIVATVSLYM